MDLIPEACLWAARELAIAPGLAPANLEQRAENSVGSFVRLPGNKVGFR